MEPEDIYIKRSYTFLNIEKLLKQEDVTLLTTSQDDLNDIILTCDLLFDDIFMCNGYITEDYIDCMSKLFDIITTMQSNNSNPYLSVWTCLLLESIERDLGMVIMQIKNIISESYEQYVPTTIIKIEKNGWVKADKVC